jgi:hypothetical protein
MNQSVQTALPDDFTHEQLLDFIRPKEDSLALLERVYAEPQLCGASSSAQQVNP